MHAGTGTRVYRHLTNLAKMQIRVPVYRVYRAYRVYRHLTNPALHSLPPNSERCESISCMMETRTFASGIE